MGGELMENYLTKGFLLSLTTAFILLIAILVITANNTYRTATIEEVNQTLQQIQTERQTITWQKIFINNMLISLPLIIPAVGLVPFLSAWINTGAVIGLLAKATGIPPNLYIQNLVILAFPEILAYTVLTAENIYFTILILTRAGAEKRLTTQSWKTLIAYVALLFIGAVTEAVMIAG